MGGRACGAASARPPSLEEGGGWGEGGGDAVGRVAANDESESRACSPGVFARFPDRYIYFGIVQFSFGQFSLSCTKENSSP